MIDTELEKLKNYIEDNGPKVDDISYLRSFLAGLYWSTCITKVKLTKGVFRRFTTATGLIIKKESPFVYYASGMGIYMINHNLRTYDKGRIMELTKRISYAKSREYADKAVNLVYDRIVSVPLPVTDKKLILSEVLSSCDAHVGRYYEGVLSNVHG